MGDKRSVRTVNFYTFGNGLQWIANYEPDSEDFHLFQGSRLGTEMESRTQVEGTHVLEHMFFRRAGLDRTVDCLRRMERKRILTSGETTMHTCHAEYVSPARYTMHTIEHAYEAIVNTDHDPVEFDMEKGIVTQEQKIRRADPHTVLSDHVLKTLYGETHYGATMEDAFDNLPRLSLSSIARLQHRLFRPNNMTLVTISNLADSKLQHKLAAYTEMPRKQDTPAYTCALPARVGLHHEFDFPVPTCYVQKTLRAFPPSQERIGDIATLRVIQHVLAGPDTSELYMRLRLQGGKTYSPLADVVMQRPEVLLDLNYTCDQRHLQHVEDIVNRVLDSVAHRGIGKELLTLDNVTKFRNIAADEFRRGIEGPNDRCAWLLKNAALGLQVRPREFEKMIRDVTPRDVRRVMQEILPGMVSIVYHPPPTVPRPVPRDASVVPHELCRGGVRVMRAAKR